MADVGIPALPLEPQYFPGRSAPGDAPVPLTRLPLKSLFLLVRDAFLVLLPSP